jgi:imidazoleglycerol-phosphate dehydratase/histidinol-phosphatase
MAERVAPALLVVDEGLIEFADAASAVSAVADHANLIVLRSLSLAYGLAGARVGAALGQRETLARLAVGTGALRPARGLGAAGAAGAGSVPPDRDEGKHRPPCKPRARALGKALSRLMMVIEPGVGPVLMARPSDPEAVLAALTRYGVAADRSGERLRLPVSAKAEINDRLLMALDLNPAQGAAHRTGQAVRDTKETRIVCAVDLDATAPHRHRHRRRLLRSHAGADRGARRLLPDPVVRGRPAHRPASHHRGQRHRPRSGPEAGAG